jgi:hypothetical protein
MQSRPQVVAELPQFIRDADSVGLSGGVRKVRFAGRGKGKSGGYRVVTAYFGPDVPVYLVAMLSKGERGNFSPGEIAGFKKMTTEIARYWRRRRQ